MRKRAGAESAVSSLEATNFGTGQGGPHGEMCGREVRIECGSQERGLGSNDCRVREPRGIELSGHAVSF